MYKTKGSAAVDLIANVPEDDKGDRIVRLLPGHIETIDAGFSMALPAGWEAQIRPRSGLAQRGVQITNSPGTIDEDYRGRLQVIVNNAGKEIILIKHGDRFAQMLLKPVWRFQWNMVKELSVTERGTGGFGSTGV
jgi:dUTP pyrophosphatase